MDGGIATINGCVGDAGNDIANGIASGSLGDIADGIATGDVNAVLSGLAAGGAGITRTKHQIGKSGPTSFVVGYETYAIPDLIEVFYEGRLIQSTGYVGDDINQGTGAVVVDVPPGLA